MHKVSQTRSGLMTDAIIKSLRESFSPKFNQGATFKGGADSGGRSGS